MKKSYILVIFLLVIFFASAKPAFAFARWNEWFEWNNVWAMVMKPQQPKVFALPKNAVEVSPNFFSLGEVQDKKSGEKVNGYVIIHKRQAGVGLNGKPLPPKQMCYSYTVDGARWRTAEPWVVNPTNTYGISNESIFNILNNSISKWEDATDGLIGNSSGKDVIGEGVTTNASLEADTTTPDGQNEVYFGQLDDSGDTIAVTIIWGMFGGAPRNRTITEWDQIYNTAYDWSDTGESAKMDFENIATHELGHSFGMGDLYNGICASTTMFGYGIEGETTKRTLETDDVRGVSLLYR